MYNARDRITKGMLKTETVLPTGKVQVCDMKMPKDTGVYVSTAERAEAKRQRENRKKLAQEGKAKARCDKQVERDFLEAQASVLEYVAPTTEAVYDFDKESAFTEEEKIELAQEMCGIKA